MLDTSGLAGLKHSEKEVRNAKTLPFDPAAAARRQANDNNLNWVMVMAWPSPNKYTKELYAFIKAIFILMRMNPKGELPTMRRGGP